MRIVDKQPRYCKGLMVRLSETSILRYETAESAEYYWADSYNLYADKPKIAEATGWLDYVIFDVALADEDDRKTVGMPVLYKASMVRTRY